MGLAAQVWSTTPDVSFVHPRGTEHGWEEVARDFYGKAMGLFSERRLRLLGDARVRVYGDTAVSEFEWDFVARSSIGESVHTTGRESQVFVNQGDGNGWRLVHVHYSGPPVTGAGQGFWQVLDTAIAIGSTQRSLFQSA